MPPERLQKVLASAGVASRRASETLIAAGRVTVDGRVARLGDQVDPETALIEVDGRPVIGSTARIYLALHKPSGVTSTVQDRHAETTVLDLVPTSLVPEGARLYPVGRLDRDSEGLLLLTNDGDWAERVLHPRFGVEREYAVGLPAWLRDEQRAALDAGIDLDEGRATFAHRIRPASAAETRRLEDVLPAGPTDLVWYRVTLRQGWKRQVRRMFAAVGAPVARLVRVRIGPVRLDDLPSGRVRRLSQVELRGAVGRVEPASGQRRAAGPGPEQPGGARRAAGPGPEQPGGSRRRRYPAR
jgi:23S rRNA pseudouridine2605 synthase